MKLHRKKILTIFFYLWIIGIYILTSTTLSGSIKNQNSTGFRADYAEHFIIYAMIPVIYFLAEGAYLKKIIKDPYYIFLLGMLFAILTEIQQYFIPDRSFNPVDLLLNIAGYLCGFFIGRKFLKRIPETDS